MNSLKRIVHYVFGWYLQTMHYLERGNQGLTRAERRAAARYRRATGMDRWNGDNQPR